jgi:hypothetical protein
MLVALAATPPPAAPPGPRIWAAHDTTAHRIAYVENGCTIVLLLSVETLAFGERASDARLTLRVARRVAPIDACAGVAESDPSDGTYTATAASYDGHHLTLRFHDASAAGDANAPGNAIFPADVSLDADLDAVPVTAHVQLIDADWDGAVDVIAARGR